MGRCEGEIGKYSMRVEGRKGTAIGKGREREWNEKRLQIRVNEGR